jgi:microcystin-dependent protein
LFLKIRLPSGALSATAKTINFSRLKFQIGELATEFVDDASLFITSPSVDSTMLQDGCIARPSLFLPNVVPTGAYQAKSINNGDVADGAIDGRCLAAGAIDTSLGYVPINKAGDTAIGPGALEFDNDDVVGTNSYLGAGIILQSTAANQANDGYMPAISFNRPTVCARAVGLAIDGRLRTIDNAGVSGYMLDSVHGVDTASYQDNSITLQKLAQSLIAVLIPPGMVRMFGGPNIPTGWLACDGSPVSRTTYAALYAAIGTYWGVGDNINTFNVPDLRGRSPLGYVNSPITGITSRAFASNGGEENHVLSVDELALHDHTITDQQHTHAAHNHTLHDPRHSHTQTNVSHQNATITSGANNQNFYMSAAGSDIGIASSLTGITMDPAGVPNAYSGITSTDNSGSDYGHNNMSPFAVMYFIIKT